MRIRIEITLYLLFVAAWATGMVMFLDWLFPVRSAESLVTAFTMAFGAGAATNDIKFTKR